MAINVARYRKISEEEYLQRELISDIKHGLIEGEVYAMSGASKNRDPIAENIYCLLGNILGNPPCEPLLLRR